MKKIVLVEHNINWANQFQDLKNIYSDFLNRHIFSVEHIGSTSIFGIKAKPILDIDILVENMESLNFVIHKLVNLGYAHQGDLGIKGREAFKQLSPLVPFTSFQREWPPHHLYVCQKDCDSVLNHLLFRNYLRSHPETALGYSALKETLVNSANDDMSLYVKGKTEFICNVLRLVGFKDYSIEKIKEQNGV